MLQVLGIYTTEELRALRSIKIISMQAFTTETMEQVCGDPTEKMEKIGNRYGLQMTMTLLDQNQFPS